MTCAEHGQDVLSIHLLSHFENLSSVQLPGGVSSAPTQRPGQSFSQCQASRAPVLGHLPDQWDMGASLPLLRQPGSLGSSPPSSASKHLLGEDFPPNNNTSLNIHLKTISLPLFNFTAPFKQLLGCSGDDQPHRRGIVSSSHEHGRTHYFMSSYSLSKLFITLISP